MIEKKRLVAGLAGGAALFLILIAAALLLPDSQQDERLARLRETELPPDGLELYQTLLREIPEVVSQVPCACCGEMLSACYRGACPPS